MERHAAPCAYRAMFVGSIPEVPGADRPDFHIGGVSNCSFFCCRLKFRAPEPYIKSACVDLELLETQLAARTSGTATEPLTMNELINELEDSPELELQSLGDSASQRQTRARLSRVATRTSHPYLPGLRLLLCLLCSYRSNFASVWMLPGLCLMIVHVEYWLCVPDRRDRRLLTTNSRPGSAIVQWLSPQLHKCCGFNPPRVLGPFFSGFRYVSANQGLWDRILRFRGSHPESRFF